MDQASAYRSGREAWPSVGLTEEGHAAAWAIDPGQPPVYVEDYFIAAAGGLYIDQAWHEIEAVIGPRVRRCLSYQATADYFIEDLWGDILLKVMAELPPDCSAPGPRLRPRTMLPSSSLRTSLRGSTVVASSGCAPRSTRSRIASARSSHAANIKGVCP